MWLWTARVTSSSRTGSSQIPSKTARSSLALDVSSILVTTLETARPLSYPRSAVVNPWIGKYATRSSTTAIGCIGSPVMFDRNLALRRTQSAHSLAIAF